ncbi:hypothetical protein FGT62_21000 [Escherichia coli]|nr:hypothetical protein [Escherichia coli]HBQ4536842.1 hypothetical protein [Escherichia coli]
MAQNNADRLVIDGGRATGKTILNLVNAGNSASGLATSGKGIQVVEAINGATTEEGAFICYVPMRGHIRFCGLNAWGCQKRSVVWLSHLPDVMASVSFIWMPALNACRVYPLSTGNQEQHEIINHGNRTGYSDCVAAGQYRLRIGNYL